MSNSGGKSSGNVAGAPKLHTIAAAPKKTKSNAQQQKKEVKRIMEEKVLNPIFGTLGRDVLTSAESVTRSFAAPLNYAPVRVAELYMSAKTAIANPWRIFNTPWDVTNTSQPANALLNPAIGFIAVFRDPVRNYVYYDPNVVATTYKYDMNFLVDSSLTKNFFFQLGTNELDFHSFDRSSIFPYAPHGDRLWPGINESDNHHYFWLDGEGDAASQPQLTINWTGGTLSGFLRAFRLDDEGLDANLIINFSGSVTSPQNLRISKPGYYRLEYYATAGATASSFTVSFLGNSSVFCHRTMPDLDNNILAQDGIRHNAAAVMYTNMASILDIQGQIAGYQSPQDKLWSTYALSTNPFTAVSLSQGSTTMKAANGMYGFLKPTQPTDLNIKKNILLDQAGIVHAFFPIYPDSDYIVLASNITTSGGRSGYYTVSNGIEYLTNDVWREVEEPSIEKAVFDIGLNDLKKVPQFHENPLHLKDIWNSVKKSVKAVANGMNSVGPILAKMSGS